MSIASVLTGGLGNGTFSGSPALLVTGGYSIESVAALIARVTIKIAGEQTILECTGTQTIIEGGGETTILSAI